MKKCPNRDPVFQTIPNSGIPPVRVPVNRAARRLTESDKRGELAGLRREFRRKVAMSNLPDEARARFLRDLRHSKKRPSILERLTSDKQFQRVISGAAA